MRGKVEFVIFAGVVHGITPAYAGKRTTCWEMCENYQDHPRLCGEKVCRKWILCYTIGSPPPMRGKDRYFRSSECFPGITPAYAGKSSKKAVNNSCLQDHPRLCGEKVDCRL